MSRAAEQDRDQRVTIDIAVVGQHTWCAHRKGGVFGRGVAVIGDGGAGGAGRVVDRSDGDADGGGSTVSLAVVGFVSEAVRPVVVECRGVGETAVAVQGQGAVSRAAEQDRDQRVTIDISVVGQHARSAYRQLSVFRCGVTVVVGRHRRVVDRSDGDGDRRDAALGLAVAGFVSEAVRAVEVQRGHVN